MYARYTDEEKDLILASLILHDGAKHGFSGSTFTVATHPTEIVEWLTVYADKHLTQEQFAKIQSCVSSHMGQWNTDYRTRKEILPKPVTAMEKFVHQCDYLASRKYLEVNFDAIKYEGERV